MAKKRRKQRLRDYADKLITPYCFRKWGRSCEICEDKLATEGHHIFTKGSYGALRYDLDNLVSISREAHIRWHRADDAPMMLEKLKKKRDEEWWNRLYEKAKEQKHSYKTNEWYEDNIKKMLDFMEIEWTEEQIKDI